jgi:hypothetical protein
VYEVDPLACVPCGSNMRIIALIDDVDVVERIRKHLKVWNPQTNTLTPAGPDLPVPHRCTDVSPRRYSAHCFRVVGRDGILTTNCSSKLK